MGARDSEAIIFCGSGCTAALKRLQEVMGIAIPSILRNRLLNTLQDHKRWLPFVGPFEHHSNLLSWRQSLAEVLELGYKSVAHYLIFTRCEVDKPEGREEDLQDMSEHSSKRMLIYDSEELEIVEHFEAKKELQHLDNKDGIKMVELVDTKRMIQLIEHFDNKDDIEMAEHVDAKPCAKLVSASSSVCKQNMRGANDLVEVGDVKAKRSKASKCTEAKLPQGNEIIVIGDETDNSARKTQPECQSIAQRLCRRRLRPTPPLSLKGHDFILNIRIHNRGDDLNKYFVSTIRIQRSWQLHHSHLQLLETQS